tara:strand:+ start:6076 stop:6672 length:597 start_codon:yes stop_codon:yes gene_type:complete
MKYSSEELIRIINSFEFLSDSIKFYINFNLNKNLFYETLKESCKLSNDLMTKIDNYVKLNKEIKYDYEKTIENEVSSKIKNNFAKAEERENDYFESYCRKNNFTQEEYFYLYYLVSLIKFNEEKVYYFELRSPLGYQGYPLLNTVQKIIVEFTKGISNDYDLNKITKLYNKMVIEESTDLIDIINKIFNEKEKYKKDS